MFCILLNTDHLHCKPASLLCWYKRPQLMSPVVTNSTTESNKGQSHGLVVNYKEGLNEPADRPTRQIFVATTDSYDMETWDRMEPQWWQKGEVYGYRMATELELLVAGSLNITWWQAWKTKTTGREKNQVKWLEFHVQNVLENPNFELLLWNGQLKHWPLRTETFPYPCLQRHEAEWWRRESCGPAAPVGSGRDWGSII